MTDPATTTVRLTRRATTRSRRGPTATELDWPEFERRLSATLARLPRDQYLIVAMDAGLEEWQYYVQFAQGGAAGFLAEAVSNDYLPGALQLSPALEAALLAIGWQSPSAHARGPENFRRQWPLATPFDEVAALGVRTLREVYGVDRPADLRYRRFHRDGSGDIAEPGLGIEAEPPRQRAADGSGPGTSRRSRTSPATGTPDLAALIRLALDDADGLDSVEENDDGIWRAKVNGTPVYVRILPVGDLAAVRIYAPVIEIPSTPDVLYALNELNAGRLSGRTVHVNGEVFVSTELSGVALTADALGGACGQVARQVAQTLAALAAITNELHPAVPSAGTALLN